MSTRTFMMGKYEASFPTDRRYGQNHMWALEIAPITRFGLTAYSERLLRDVYFLDWCIEPNTEVESRQLIGSIESKKAESALFAPVSGRLVRFNDRLMNDPSMINKDIYGDGWLFEMEGVTEVLLSATSYVDHLAQIWEVTQRMLKGQS